MACRERVAVDAAELASIAKADAQQGGLGGIGRQDGLASAGEI